MTSQVTQISSIYQIPPPLGTMQWCKIPPIDGNSTGGGSRSGETDFDRLLPTLAEVFAVIICGYIAGRFRLISPSEVKGLNDFTTYFSMLPLIFLNLVTINFAFVNWTFVLSILLGKVIVFALVACVTSAVKFPMNLAYAGIYGIFCTQGNDFGLAYPIMSSLYGNRRPMYPGYMYLIAPTSLIVTNPLGFLLMEIQKNRIYDGDSKSRGLFSTTLRTIGAVSWAVMRNYVVCATLLGILGNFLFHGSLPNVVYGILQLLSSAFSASILFLLGISAVGYGSSEASKRDGVLVPGLLLVAKMIVSPVVTRGSIQLLCSGSPDIEDLSDFGFLYGMIPTGPIVMLFAAKYCLKTDMLAITMVISTALFGPVIYVLGRMVSLNVKGPGEYLGELKETMFVLSILNMLSCAWICLCITVSRKWRNHIYKVTVCLLLSQIIMSIGIFLWGLLETDHKYMIYFEVAFITSGQLMSRIWVTLLAATLLVKQKRPNIKFSNNILYPMGLGFAIPFVVIVILLIVTSLGKCEPEVDRQLPLFTYGRLEAIAAIVVLLICLLVTICSIVLYYRSLSSDATERERKAESVRNNEGSDNAFVNGGHSEDEKGVSVDHLIDGTSTAIQKLTRPTLDLVAVNQKEKESHAAVDVTTSGSEKTKDRNCWKVISSMKRSETSFSQKNLLSDKTSEKSQSPSSPVGGTVNVSFDTTETEPSSSSTNIVMPEDHKEKKTYLRHVIVLIVSCISIAVGLTTSSWKLTTNHTNGLFVAMEFLDVVLSVGQGVFVFIIFIKDSKYIFNPIAKWLKKFTLSKTSHDLELYAIDEVTRQQCHQFLTYHLNNCIRDLPKNIEEENLCFAKSFTGKDLVEWLIKVGLANNRSNAEVYGQRLMVGNVIQSVNRAVQFHDSESYIYRLTAKRRTA